MKETQTNHALLIFLYLLAFVLLKEALQPIIVLTETGYFALFIGFIAISMILALLKISWKITGPIKILYIIWAIQVIYIEPSFPSLEVFSLMFKSFVFDISVLIKGEWASITNVSRTLLFYLMLWMIAYLLQYWIEVKKSIFLFYFTTIVFLATVDTFSPYSVESSIFSIMVIGLLLLGLLTITKLTAKYKIEFSLRQLPAVVMPLVFLLVISMGLVTLLPKFSPVWADPVPFIKSMAEKGQQDGQTVSKSGYGTNDEQLGGPFLEDDSLVFEANVKGKQYWKVETKDMYTSKGWEQSTIDPDPLTFSEEDVITQNFLADGEIEVAELSMTEKFPFLIYPYGLTGVETSHDAMFMYDQLTGKYDTLILGEKHPLDAYMLEFIEPAYSLKRLKETSMEQFENEPQLDAYLQLPETLPERVKELATTITASSESVYDKAKAIENYFNRNGFVYERTDVAIPSADEDYVDQFLFDTKKGYCDNFSSSMVVMLRTLDIPARWVKGFAPGELARDEDGNSVFRVSNNEAHSWVEAHMPGIGWMSFEPTIGFTGITDITYDLEEEATEEELSEQEQEQPEREEEKEKENRQDIADEEIAFDIRTSLNKGKGLIILGVIVLLVIGTLIYVKRKHWITKVLIRRQQSVEVGWPTFKRQYTQLLKQLERVGFKRAKGETLRAFAVKVDRHFGGEEMQKLTAIYEKSIYGKIEKNEEWQRLQKMWEDLIKKTSN